MYFELDQRFRLSNNQLLNSIDYALVRSLWSMAGLAHHKNRIWNVFSLTSFFLPHPSLLESVSEKCVVSCVHFLCLFLFNFFFLHHKYSTEKTANICWHLSWTECHRPVTSKDHVVWKKRKMPRAQAAEITSKAT